MIRENTQPITSADQNQTAPAPAQLNNQKKESFDQKILNFFKNFEIKPTKGKLFALIIVICILLLVYAGLTLLAIKPQSLPQPPAKKAVVEEATPAAKSAELQNLEKKVNDFKLNLDKLENFRKDFNPPNPDLKFEFK